MKDNDKEFDAAVIKRIIEMGDSFKENWGKRFDSRLTLTDIARKAFSVEQMPPGALPIYDTDLDVSKIVMDDKEEKVIQEFETWLPDGLTTNGKISVGNVTIDIPDFEGISIDNRIKKKDWIQTFSGIKFDPIEPRIDDINIADIAQALSNQCRFSGHVKEFYSVAHHCVLVSYICDSKDALQGLLHDASEAYLVDVPRPLKYSGKFEAYREMENHLQSMIYRKYSLPEVEPSGVKVADIILLATEARDLMAPLHPEWIQPAKPLPFKIIPLSPKEARILFVNRFNELTSIHNDI